MNSITYVTARGERVVIRWRVDERGLVYVTAPDLSTHDECGPFGDEREACAFFFGPCERKFGHVREIVRG